MRFRKSVTVLACLLALGATAPAVVPDMTASVALSASAATNGTQDGWKYTLYEDHAVITGCEDTSITSLEIPGEIEGLPVTVLGNQAFNGYALVAEVIIPDSVTSIGSETFKNCKMLKSVTIPDSVKTIGISAFAYCTGLENLTLGENVMTIESSAFSGCSSLGNFVIPDKVATLGGSAFSECGISEITIPETVTTIGSRCFSSCKGLETVTISSSGAVGNNAFQNCTGLFTLTLENVTSIGSDAFSGCKMLQSVTISDSVKTIGISAFSGCSSLKTIDIPESVTSIGSSAFYGTSLNSVTIRNKGCDIYESNSTLPVTKDGTIYGMENSSAQNYAEKYGYTFALIGGQPVTPPTGNDAYDAGDLDGNGTVNATDAAIILQYAAEAGAGSFTGTMAEYLIEKGYRS